MFEVLILLALAFCVGFFAVMFLPRVERTLQAQRDRELARSASRGRHPSTPRNVTPITSRQHNDG